MTLTSRNRLDGGGTGAVRGVDPGLLVVGLSVRTSAGSSFLVPKDGRFLGVLVGLGPTSTPHAPRVEPGGESGSE